jgi:transaldolase
MTTAEPGTPLAQTMRHGTEIWHDGAVAAELSAAIAAGATGATSNPSLVLDAVDRERALWTGRVRALAADRPGATDSDLAGAVVREIAVRGGGVLGPVFDREQGRRGRFASQVTPAIYGDADATVDEGLAIAASGPNLQPKIPATRAGLEALEALSARGVTAMATACFTVSQAVAVAQAVERGLERASASGHDTGGMTPLCVFLVGRTDDWIAALALRGGGAIDASSLEWPGIACVKAAYRVYRERGYRTRLLVAGFRRELHWSAFVGGDLVLSITPPWWQRIEASTAPTPAAIDEPVDPGLISRLSRAFPDFARAVELDGFGIGDFDALVPMVRTLRGFLRARHELLAFVADVLLPDPLAPRERGGDPPSERESLQE